MSRTALSRVASILRTPDAPVADGQAADLQDELAAQGWLRLLPSAPRLFSTTLVDQRVGAREQLDGRWLVTLAMHDDYVRQALSYPKQLVDKIDAAMWSRLRPSP